MITLPGPDGVVEVDGAQLNYALAGDGVPLVVVPGGPGFGFQYLYPHLTSLLGDSYRLLFYDQRGTGHSTGVDDPARLTMAAFVDDLEQLRQATGLSKLNLLGHSFGGLLALHYAIEHPHRVGSLILLAPDPANWEVWSRFQEVVSARRTADDQRIMDEIQATPGWSEDPAAVERYGLASLASYFGHREVADQLAFGMDAQVVRNNAITYNAIRQDLGRWNIEDRLGEILAPTLILYGGASIFPAGAGPALQTRIAGSRLVMFGGVGHFPHMEAPADFVAAVREFLPPG